MLSRSWRASGAASTRGLAGPDKPLGPRTAAAGFAGTLAGGHGLGVFEGAAIVESVTWITFRAFANTVAYADQVERDYATFVKAVRSGRLKSALSPSRLATAPGRVQSKPLFTARRRRICFSISPTGITVAASGSAGITPGRAIAMQSLNSIGTRRDLRTNS